MCEILAQRRNDDGWQPYQFALAARLPANPGCPARQIRLFEVRRKSSETRSPRQ